MRHTIIKNAKIINEGVIMHGDVLVIGNRIEKIAPQISISDKISYREINADKLYLIPGMIDAHVHFRDPGYPMKGSIRSESAAAIKGGVTSFMDMPNTLPSVLTNEILEEKYKMAAANSFCNYSFFMGLSKSNLEEALKTNTEDVCGLTDDGLYFDNDEGLLCNHLSYLEKLFARSEHLVALHSEDDSIINENLKKYQTELGEFIPPNYHVLIRSEESCLRSTKNLIDLSRKYNNRLHLLHISTSSEVDLFSWKENIAEKRITTETCIHYLYFNERDYDTLGNLIKWNPSIKKEKDQVGLLKGLHTNQIDFITTDHAPHTFTDKIGNYFNSKSGAPMVQHSLAVLFELYHQGKITLEKIVKKTSHDVAEAYRIRDRGYIREGYYADLVLIDLDEQWTVSNDNILYGCKWSPLLNHTFKGKIKHVMVNGNHYSNGEIKETHSKGMRLKFEKNR
jgi:dihydroorotase